MKLAASLVTVIAALAGGAAPAAAGPVSAPANLGKHCTPYYVFGTPFGGYVPVWYVDTHCVGHPARLVRVDGRQVRATR